MRNVVFWNDFINYKPLTNSSKWLISPISPHFYIQSNYKINNLFKFVPYSFLQNGLPFKIFFDKEY